jgi:hypothetical protein
MEHGASQSSVTWPNRQLPANASDQGDIGFFYLLQAFLIREFTCNIYVVL